MNGLQLTGMELTEHKEQVDKEEPIGYGKVKARGEDIRRFILENVEKHPKDIASRVAAHFNITRQAVNKHIQKLVAHRALTPEGETRNRRYKLAVLHEWSNVYRIGPELLEEDQVWSRDVAPALGALPKNVMDIWNYCVTEMLNNAIDHSGGTRVYVSVARTAAHTEIHIDDDGIGIFKKIQSELGLIDERHAILELLKGKLTTDPEHHTGQGIFFTSRMLDAFNILSGGVFLNHIFGDDDWILERPSPASGTVIFMKLNNHSSRTDTEIFKFYSSADGLDFSKTVVPVKLAQYGDDKLVSRSQAKRLLSRVDQFQTVIFDFDGVEAIGQAFADEIFRIFAKGHPEIQIIPTNANPQVQQAIHSTRSRWASEATDSI